MGKSNIQLFRESTAISDEESFEISLIYRKIELKKQEIIRAEREIKAMQIEIPKIKKIYETKKEKLWD